MQRRSFLTLAGLSGISLFLPWGGEASADPASWGGPFVLHMHASGGWDPTLLCDAKLTAGGPTPVYENRLVTAVDNVNGVPVAVGTAAGKFLLRSGGNALEDPAHFFQNAGRGMLVLNGVDTQTNNHDVGVQGLACGHNDIELPCIAALFAGMVARQQNIPMAFLAGGQYNRTGDVVGVSRFPGDKVPLLAEPFKGAATEDKGLLSDVAQRRIVELRGARLAQLDREATLPRNKRTLHALLDATKGGDSINLLKRITSAPAPSIDAFRDGLAPDTAAYLTSKNPATNVERFIEIGAPLETILRCFQTGVSASATYAQGGFDTHATHDVNQTAAQATFLARVRYVLLRAQQMGIADKLFLMVTSDFGRTPKYNTGDGKDHWNVTSVLVSGPQIRGGRAVGKTDEGHKALRVGANDVNQTLPYADESGIRVHAGHVHREMRRVLGLDNVDFVKQFPLPQTDASLPLFV